MPPNSPKVPLAIGILKSLFAAAPDLDRHGLINAIADYCGGQSYQRALVVGVNRIGLDGKPAGTVSPSHAEHARKSLATIP
jgi:ProP effector